MAYSGNEQDSFNNPIYKQQISHSMEVMKEAFKKIDKNDDDVIDQKEIADFLNSLMPVNYCFYIE